MTSKQKSREEKLIKICSGHQDYKTPLIWTFAFTGAEYWCPACGYLGGMLGSGKNVPVTKVLVNRLNKYKKESKAYLRGNSLLCCAYFKYKGENRKFGEMSDRFKNYWIKKSKDWKYKYE